MEGAELLQGGQDKAALGDKVRLLWVGGPGGLVVTGAGLPCTGPEAPIWCPPRNTTMTHPAPTQVNLVDGFAGVYPEHKYAIVEAYQSHGRLVGMTGEQARGCRLLKMAPVGMWCGLFMHWAAR